MKLCLKKKSHLHLALSTYPSNITVVITAGICYHMLIYKVFFIKVYSLDKDNCMLKYILAVYNG